MCTLSCIEKWPDLFHFHYSLEMKLKSTIFPLIEFTACVGQFSSESPEISCHPACIVLCAFSYHKDHDNQDIAPFFWLDFKSLMCGNQNITMKLKRTDRSKLFIVWNTQFIESNQTVWLKFHLNLFMVCNTVIL